MCKTDRQSGEEERGSESSSAKSSYDKSGDEGINIGAEIVSGFVHCVNKAVE